jgi:hypothetical protein
MSGPPTTNYVTLRISICVRRMYEYVCTTVQPSLTLKNEVTSAKMLWAVTSVSDHQPGLF